MFVKFIVKVVKFFVVHMPIHSIQQSVIAFFYFPLVEVKAVFVLGIIKYVYFDSLCIKRLKS